LTISRTKHIVIAPLDWGLGHTTRCVPIISYLLENGHKVTIAGNDSQLTFLHQIFPGLPSVFLKGYNIRYAKNRAAFNWKIARQIPQILQSIRNENAWLNEQLQKQHFDGIISDNRYGLYHEKIPSVIVTHQLQVQSGMGNFMDARLRKLHYKYLNRFNECWVPDVPGMPNLSGVLAHPNQVPKHTRYIGLLSQLKLSAKPTTDESLLILLSGLEPQRTVLHEILWQQLRSHNGKVVFIAGTNSYPKPENIPAHIAYHERISKEQLQPLLEAAGLVICRSGYSSLMDLVAVNKNAILIPTPGQTEQEYLAHHLHRQQIFMHIPQENFNLPEVLHAAANFPFQPKQSLAVFELFKKVLDKWLASL
jgi:predicted glycosyltransferase